LPQYRLQTVLEIRQRAKDAAEQAFGEAMAALAKEQAALKKLEEDLARRKVERKAKVAAYMQEVVAKGGHAGGLSSLNRFEDRLKDEEMQVSLEIDRQKDVVLDAQRVVDEKRAAMAEAAKDLKAIEKHKDKWVKQVRTERDMREELAQEEIGNALFLQRQKK